jgi:hypothetical protein
MLTLWLTNRCACFNRNCGIAARPATRSLVERYFSDELIAVNLVLSLVPSPLTTAMMASAMPAAIRPYSMAVAPD